MRMNTFQTIPFLGGREIAERYLVKHKEVYGDRIGILYSDDLKNQPLCHVLYFGSGDEGLISFYNLDNCGRVLGVLSLEALVACEKGTLKQRVRVFDKENTSR